VLLVAVLVTGVTTFMFLPLLAIDLTARGVRAGVMGAMVGLLAFSSQGFSLVTGLLLDRFGALRVLGCGFAFRIAGYLILGLSPGKALAPLTGGIVAIGVGGSMLGLTIKTMLVTEPASSPRAMLALRSTFVNVGVVVGPALGALTYRAGFRVILLVCVLSHLVLAIRLVQVRANRPEPRRPAVAEATSANIEAWASSSPAEVPSGSASPPGSAPNHVSPARAGTVAAATQSAVPHPVWGAANWGTLCVITVAYWAIYSQLNTVVPVAVKAMTGTPTAISVIFTLNGALVVLFQYVLLQRVFKRADARTLLILGFVSFAIAYTILMSEAGWWSVLCFVLPLTLAEMLIGPSLDEQVVRVAPRHRTGRALGVLSTAAACGSLLGASLGGTLFEALDGRAAVWMAVAGCAVAAAGASALLPKSRRGYV
jgi:MFS family permease